MSFEPQKFFIGVIDFFSILLPGALLTFFLQDSLGPIILCARYSRLTVPQTWIVFLVSSYLFGHFIFLIGSWLLDDYVYDRIRDGTYAGQIRRLASGKRPSWPPTRALAAFFVKKDADSAQFQANRIKQDYLEPLGSSSAVNIFKWCKAMLVLTHPEAVASVERFEADSKFFRSLLVVLCVLIALAVKGHQWIPMTIGLSMVVLAFWRYVEQRLKTTTQAYAYVIAMEGKGDSPPPRRETHAVKRPSHAGGVVFRRNRNGVEFLLVQASQSPHEWVLPKGHIERGEKPREAAVREVREETGVWARIVNKLEVLSFIANDQNVSVEFFLMEAAREEKPTEPREHVWLNLEKAVTQVTHSENAELLKKAGILVTNS